MSETRDILGTSKDAFQIGDAGPKIVRSGANIEARTSDLSGLTNFSSLNTNAVAARRNNAGQIKASYATLSLVNFTANTRKTFDINASTPTLSSSPTTTYPFSSPSQTYAAMFDATRGATPTGRLIENPIGGQSHTWRIQGTYANKGNNNTGSLLIVLRNLNTPFQYVCTVALPEGVTSGAFNVEGRSIADDLSIPSPEGYVLEAEASFTDNDFTVSIVSITRFSNAVEITTAV